MGGGKRSRGTPGSNLGKALQSARDKNTVNHRRVVNEGISHIHASEVHRKEAFTTDLTQSSTTPDHVTDFLATVQLANKEFEVERPEHHMLKIIAPSQKDFTETIQQMSKLPQDILIPRRPVWTSDMTKEQLDRGEKDAFLSWRRELAEHEESSGAVFTPFEKNIEFWRQLWRVIERSDLIVQLVDARRPLLYRCADVEKYVTEVGLRQGEENERKTNLLLVNKADLVSEEQRKQWAQYFNEQGIDFAFFSAVEEQEKIDDIKENAENQEAQNTEEIEEEEKEVTLPANDWDILNKEQFKLLVREKRKGKVRFNDDHITVGMIGYPNVGKSSCINVLIQDKKVSVSATPGKTKHFQTLFCGDDREILLCDCPGLVFPSQVTSKEELVLAGILPINHIRDYIAPVALLCQLIPRPKLEAAYGIAILLSENIGDLNADRQPTAGEFLDPMAAGRGFRTSRGQPDRSRAARLSIKDFLQGRLLFVHPPPSCDDHAEFHSTTIETEKDTAKLERRLRMVETKMLQSWKLDKVDRAFFGQTTVRANVSGMTGADGKYSLQRENGKQRVQDLKSRKKDKQRRIREKQLKRENNGIPDWIE